MPYETLLKRALDRIPKKAEEGTRWSPPRAQVLKAGLKTIITNFDEIVQGLRRPEDHFLKFILKELATKGERDGKRLVVIGSFSEEHINRKIDTYIKLFVVCPTCNKPDTKLVKKDKFHFLVCEACGARHALGR